MSLVFYGRRRVVFDEIRFSHSWQLFLIYFRFGTSLGLIESKYFMVILDVFLLYCLTTIFCKYGNIEIEVNLSFFSEDCFCCCCCCCCAIYLSGVHNPEPTTPILLVVWIWRHVGHVGVQNNEIKCLLGIWLYYYTKLVGSFYIVLYTNMAVSSLGCKPRIDHFRILTAGLDLAWNGG